MQFVFLGTGAGSPTLLRNTSSIAFCHGQNNSNIWLFDCGESTLIQLMKAKLKINRMSHIFITHLHADHILGLSGLLLSAGFRQRCKPLTIFAPKGLKTFLDCVFMTTQTEVSFPLIIHETEVGQIYHDEQFQLFADKLDHRIECFGYRIEQHDFLNQKGKIVTILGDTRPCEGSLRLAKNADVLVHESTYMNEYKAKAELYGHSTAIEAAQIAKQAGVKQLILTHLSARYSKTDEVALRDEAQILFDRVKVACDLMTYLI